MRESISNTSPLLYLHRARILAWLPELFDGIWIPRAVMVELEEGRRRGYDVPEIDKLSRVSIVDPQFVPSEWLALDLGAGEVAAMSLALENPNKVVLLDDGLARRIAKTAGLAVWGTLKILLEEKHNGITDEIRPFVDLLAENGMWISKDIRRRILFLAGEEDN